MPAYQASWHQARKASEQENKLQQDIARAELRSPIAGIILTKAVAEGTTDTHANLVTPQLAGPHHQHLFNVRLDFADLNADVFRTPATLAALIATRLRESHHVEAA